VPIRLPSNVSEAAVVRAALIVPGDSEGPAESCDPYSSIMHRDTFANGRFNFLMLTAVALTSVPPPSTGSPLLRHRELDGDQLGVCAIGVIGTSYSPSFVRRVREVERRARPMLLPPPTASGGVKSMLAEFGTGQVFWSMLWFFLFFIWIWLLIVVFGDIFRSRDLSGWGKALWSIFIIVLPYLGVFVYLIARGQKMQEHTLQAAKEQDAAFRQYVQEATTSSSASPAAEVAKLAELRDTGVISDAEFEQAKAKALS
jgi:putative oligomerization/nucleic acid binding protein/phospholipase D-like protein